MSTLRIVGVSGGLSHPSRTSVLVKAVLRELETLAHGHCQLIELVTVGPVIGPYLRREQLPPEGEEVVGMIESADVIVAGSPVYKGAYTGPFKHLFDMVDPNALVDVPVVLAATGGSDRHMLMTEHTLRPLFSFFRAHTVPTSLYATAAQLDESAIVDPSLSQRIAIAARQALHVLGARAPRVNEVPVRQPLVVQ
jgi:FMN reductase